MLQEPSSTKEKFDRRSMLETSNEPSNFNNTKLQLIEEQDNLLQKITFRLKNTKHHMSYSILEYILFLFSYKPSFPYYYSLIRC